MHDCDVLVIGGGHAGIEAASAASRLGCSVILVTMDVHAIGRMSCNPAIGGVAKGQLVREIEALGGLMGLAADACGIHFRMLNASRGAAVWGPRAQQDMDAYALWMQAALALHADLHTLSGEVEDLIPSAQGWTVALRSGQKLSCKKVVLTTGTFASACLHRGEDCWAGGRVGEDPAASISGTLTRLGFALRRLKTGTPARLRRDSIHWNLAEEQPGDLEPWAFSPRSRAVQNRISCHIVRTSALTHEALRQGFGRSPLFNGTIKGLGPRYCPSIEDKIFRFADRDSHQLFLEPEGLENDRVYINGFSSSLPADVQDAALRTIPALADCDVIRYGYAVEYDAIDATTLHPTLESRVCAGLYVAGQTCGTSGYEEAAAQGLLVGANAALQVLGRTALLPDRASSYLGVLADDLTSMPLDEPYRLFTSRAEHRLHLRHDNAEERLTPMGRTLGLIDDAHWENFCTRRDAVEAMGQKLSETKLVPERIRPFLEERGEAIPHETVRARDIARRPQVELADLVRALEPEGFSTLEAGRLGILLLQSRLRYESFFAREERDLERVKRMSGVTLPDQADWMQVQGLSIEARQSLQKNRPLTVGQAAKLPGVRPADVEVLLLLL